MCIIVAKEKGVKMPSYETLETCFFNNPDGAGYMVARGGKVEIHKGFMDFSSFYNEVKRIPRDVPAVLHFRIGTHGGNVPENTHPFPVKRTLGALKSLDITCNTGVAHNGVIYGVTPLKGISDTMQYIHERLYPAFKACPDFLEVPALMAMLKGDISSKMAFLQPDGKISLVGSFEKENGIYYSNNTFKPYSYKKYASKWDDYNYYDDYYLTSQYYGTTKKKKKKGKKSKAQNVDVFPLMYANSPYVFNSKGLECGVPDNYGVDKDGAVYYLGSDGKAYHMKGYKAYDGKDGAQIMAGPNDTITYVRAYI